MKGRIVVVRHGNTPYNTGQVFQPLDSNLSDLGWQQAEMVGQRIAKEFNVRKILVSDLPRTKQTAASIYSSLSETVYVVESELLRERDFGSLVGMSIYDAPKDLFRHSLPHYAPEGAESWYQFHSRVDSAWEWVLQQAEAAIKHEDDVVVVVTHGLVKSRLARIWGHTERVHFENTSVSVVSLQHPHTIETLNCYAHLGEDATSSGGGESKL